MKPTDCFTENDRNILWEGGGPKYINAIINFTCENILFNIKNNVLKLWNENLEQKLEIITSEMGLTFPALIISL